MTTKKGYNLEEGDRIVHENGLNYEIVSIDNYAEGKMRLVLRPYQNSMSASKRMSVSTDKDFIIAQ